MKIEQLREKTDRKKRYRDRREREKEKEKTKNYDEHIIAPLAFNINKTAAAAAKVSKKLKHNY